MDFACPPARRWKTKRDQTGSELDDSGRAARYPQAEYLEVCAAAGESDLYLECAFLLIFFEQGRHRIGVVGFQRHAFYRIDSPGDYVIGNIEIVHWRTLQGRFHEINPDRQRRPRRRFHLLQAKTPLSCPTHTPAEIDGENPIKMASRVLLVVPVLPATGRPMRSADLPVPSCMTAVNILVTIAADARDMTMWL